MPGAMQQMSEARKAVFLRILAECGIFTWAARAASSHATSKGAAATFRALMARDPDFAALVQDARDAADANLEKAAWDRAVKGVDQKQFQRGVQVTDAEGNPGVQTVYSDKLLEMLLASRDKRFARKHQHEHTGIIQHSSTSILQIGMDDMDALDGEQRDQLKAILINIQKNRKGVAPMLTHNPGKVIEGESEVVEAEPVEAKRYQRKPFDKKESLKEYRDFIGSDGDTLAEIESLEREQRGDSK